VRIVIVFFLLMSYSGFSQVRDSLFMYLFTSDTVTVQLETDVEDGFENQSMTITHRNGNWYRVQYINTRDRSVKRLVHKSRLRRFSKRLEELTTQNLECEGTWVTVYCNSTTGSQTGDFQKCEVKQLEKLLRILKIW
jgi:hypothetical protein